MDASFTVITSNIRFSTTDDGLHRWENRRPMLSRILLSHRPALIATQEGREPQLRELASSLAPLKLVADGRPWIEERMYPCLFIDPTQVEVLSNGDFWLSETPEIPGSFSFDSTFPRLCTWARVKIRGEAWLIASTHLDHVLVETRKQQSQVLVQQLKVLRQHDENILLMGDFNDEPQSETRQVFTDAFPELYDPWSMPEESSHHPFSGSCPTGHRIDWILLPQKKKVLEIFLDKTNEQGKWPSDHFPVICKIKA